MIGTQTIGRLRKMVENMKKVQEQLLAEAYRGLEFKTSDQGIIVNNLLSMAEQIKNCEKARKYFQKMSFDLTEQEYFEMAMKVIELSKTLPEDFSKRVFRDVVLDEGLLDAVLSATRNPTLQAEAKELLWFVAEAAPLYYWTNEDSSHFLDCWNFNLVRTSEGFERLLDKGKRELFHKNFKHIRIAFGTKSEYCDSDEKKEMSKKFKSCDIGKTGDFERTMNILFPSKYTTGNYYIYIPKV